MLALIVTIILQTSSIQLRYLQFPRFTAFHRKTPIINHNNNNLGLRRETAMGVRQAVLQLSIAATTLAMPFSPKRESGIQWGNCSFAATVPILCATLPVPLDYNDTTSNATLDLSLIKVPVATNVTSKGSILFNFGGPGDEAVQTLASIAPQLQK